MNWQKVENILKDCTKGPTHTYDTPKALQSDYVEFLKRFNGVEGFIGTEQYLLLWSSEQIEELNTAYSTPEFLSGVVLIGTDGSDTGFGVDSNGRYVRVPLVGMSLAQTTDLGGSFEEFLDRLISD
jgi:hypothetical protein